MLNMIKSRCISTHILVRTDGGGQEAGGLRMSFMKWESTFELDITEFDDHHKYLVGLMNALHANYASVASNETIGVVVDELVDYAVYHFRAEEQWMEDHNYQGLPPHRDEHRAFAEKMSEFQKDFKSGKSELTIEVLTFLMNWLKDHILGSDANYGKFAKRLSHNI
jgi:hemerythrin